MTNPNFAMTRPWKLEVEPIDDGVRITMLVGDGPEWTAAMTRFMDLNIDALHADQLLAGLALALDRRRRDRVSASRGDLSVVRA